MLLNEGNSKTFWGHPISTKIDKNDLVIWMIPVTIFPELYPKYGSLLTQEEQNRADRFHKAQDFKNYVNGKIGTRLLLGYYLHQEPTTFCFYKGRFSKPYLLGNPTLQFNISHSDKWVTVAMSVSEIGIDIEKTKPVNDISSFKDVFTKDELEFIVKNPTLKNQRFFFIWTRKESFLKQKGIGIDPKMNTFSVLNNVHKSLQYKSYFIDQEYVLSVCYPSHLENIYFHPFQLSLFTKPENKLQV